MADKAREIWVDNVKVIACAFVVLGHFYQSMVKSGLMADSAFYGWFNQTIYTFHVPLFFICSGYLYQRFSHVYDKESWWYSVRKKLVVLGIPYLLFTVITVAMKALAGDLANSGNSNLLHTLFAEPIAPYWYLYVLFFMFAVTPTPRTGKGVKAIVLIAVCAEVVYLFAPAWIIEALPYFVSRLMIYEIWFAAGIAIAYFGRSGFKLVPGAIGVVLFFTASVCLYAYTDSPKYALFLLGVIACYSIISLTMAVFPDGRQNSAFGFAAKFTMPVYLMHTIFAAGYRVLLVKLGVYSPLIHVGGGLVISFAGPILAMFVLDRYWKLDFLVYPGRHLRIEKSSNRGE